MEACISKKCPLQVNRETWYFQIAKTTFWGQRSLCRLESTLCLILVWGMWCTTHTSSHRNEIIQKYYMQGLDLGKVWENYRGHGAYMKQVFYKVTVNQAYLIDIRKQRFKKTLGAITNLTYTICRQERQTGSTW